MPSRRRPDRPRKRSCCARFETSTARVIAVDHFDPAELARGQQPDDARPRLVPPMKPSPPNKDRPCRRHCPTLHGLALLDRLRGHRLGDVRPRGREPEFARPPAARGAGRDRRVGGGRARRGDLAGLVFMSAKEKGFIVGADMREFDASQRPRHQVEDAGQQTRAARSHRALPIPVVAASTASASAAGSSWRSPATGASPTATTAPASASPR